MKKENCLEMNKNKKATEVHKMITRVKALMENNYQTTHSSAARNEGARRLFRYCPIIHSQTLTERYTKEH